MAANVLFKLLTEAQWNALTTKDNGTLYRVQLSGGGEDFYQGSNKLNGAAGEIEAAIAALDGSAGIASESNGVVTIKAGVTETDGVISNSSASDITLAKLATTAAAEDLSYTNTTSGLTATDAQAAIDEIVDGLGTAAAADVATTAIQEESTDTGLVSAAQVATFVATEIADLEGAMHFVGVITRQTGETDAEAIARVVTSPEAGDVVVMSDNAKEYIYTGTAWREVGDEGLYVQKTTTIAGVDLEDNITKSELLTALNVEDGAQENVIESVKVNGSALTPDANKAVDVLIAEGATNGSISVAGSDVSVHGLGSAAYVDVEDFDAEVANYTPGTGGDPDTGVQADGLKVKITQADGVLTGVTASIVAGTYDLAGAASSAESNAEAYADNLLTWQTIS